MLLNNYAMMKCYQLLYSFFKKKCGIYAKAISVNILEFDSKVPYTIKYECDAILKKLPNCQEYMQLPEYETLVKLLEKVLLFTIQV